MKKRIILSLLLCIALVVSVFATKRFLVTKDGSNGVVFANDTESTKDVANNSQTVTDSTKEHTTKKKTKKKKEVKKVDIVAVGDDLVSDSVLKLCKKSDGTYDFNQVYSVMKKDFKAADIAIINQETMMGGNTYPYRGYPNFNTPSSMAKAIKNAGFDIVTQATNHSMDTGITGIKNDLSVWNKYKKDIFLVGLNKSKKQYTSIPIYEKNGIKFAILNYTYGLNGYKLPSTDSYRINLLDSAHWNKVKSDIQRAEKLADFTIVLPHWGTEYVQPGPTADQKKWAEMMTGAGADLIIGTHPHVIESVSWIKVGKNKKALCYYSLGNYTSGQTEWPRILGGMAKLTVQKKNGKTSIVKKTAGIVPIVTHYEYGAKIQKTYKLSDYTTKLASKHGIQQYSRFSVKDLNDMAEKIVGKWIVE